MSKFLPADNQVQSTNNNTTPTHGFLHRVICVDTLSPEQSMYVNSLGYVVLANIAVFASNSQALGAGLVVGTLYRNGDNLCIVH